MFDPPDDRHRPAPARGARDGGEQPLAELDEIARALAELDAKDLPDGELGPAVLALLRTFRRLDAALLHLVGELDARGLCELDVGLRAATWLTAKAHVAPGTARALVRDAKTLRSMPNVDRAMTDGRIGSDLVRVFGRAANPRVRPGVDSAVDYLLSGLDAKRFDVTERDIHDFARDLDQDGGHDPKADEPEDSVTMGRCGDALHFRGTLHGENAATFEQALDALTTERFRNAQADAKQTADLPVPSAPALRAQALADMARRSMAQHPSDTRPAAPDVTVIVHVPEGGNLADAVATTPAGHRLPQHVLDVMCCDGALAPVLVDTRGLPMFVGRAQRLATAAQRRALAARDGGCGFPDCPAPHSWCDAHHVVPWEHGGATDLDNLVSLCRYHHTKIHSPGWHATLDPDQHLRITTPGGDTLVGQRHGRRANAPPHAA